MRKSSIFISIGLISGVVLALFLKIMEILTDNRAYYLLFDVDYIPFLKEWRPVILVEVLFHFGTCIISIAALYVILTFFHLAKSMTAYVIVIGVGSAVLFFLTALSEKTPPVSDVFAWLYWVIGHLFFSLTAGFLIKRWL